MRHELLNARVGRMILFTAAFILLSIINITHAQEKSIHPGINDRFRNPDVKQWIARFEMKDRPIYKRRDEIVAILDLTPGMDAADIGAGTGFFTMLFAEKVGPKGTVYAIDIAENFVNHVTKTAGELGLNNVKGIVNSDTSTNLEKNSVDVVFMADTYHHFEYPFKMLESIRSALRPDGIVVLVDLERIEGVTAQFVLDMVRAGKGTFTDEFRNAGSELIEEVPFSEKDYILKFKLRQ